MTPTRIVNVHHAKPYDIRIMRAGSFLEGEGIFGNPSRLKTATMRERVMGVLSFIRYFRHRMGLRWDAAMYEAGWPFGDTSYFAAVHGLRGKILGCVCKPLWCHGDVYAAYLNEGPAGVDRLEQELAAQVPALSAPFAG